VIAIRKGGVLRTTSLLLNLPTPDFSMPYNVIILSSTVIALAFGSVFNLLVRRFVVLKPGDAVVGNKLRGLVLRLILLAQEKLGGLVRREEGGDWKCRDGQMISGCSIFYFLDYSYLPESCPLCRREYVHSNMFLSKMVVGRVNQAVNKSRFILIPESVLYIRSFFVAGTAVGLGGTGISHHVSSVARDELLDRAELVMDVVLWRGEDFVDVLEDRGRGLDMRTRVGEGKSDGWKFVGSESVREIMDRGRGVEHRGDSKGEYGDVGVWLGEKGTVKRGASSNGDGFTFRGTDMVSSAAVGWGRDVGLSGGVCIAAGREVARTGEGYVGYGSDDDGCDCDLRVGSVAYFLNLSRSARPSALADRWRNGLGGVK
jgi:Gpi16 subunit, GPI transamidase component